MSSLSVIGSLRHFERDTEEVCAEIDRTMEVLEGRLPKLVTTRALVVYTHARLLEEYQGGTQLDLIWETIVDLYEMIENEILQTLSTELDCDKVGALYEQRGQVCYTLIAGRAFWCLEVGTKAHQDN